MKRIFKLLPFSITLLINSQISFADVETIKNAAKSFPREMKPEFIDQSSIENLYILSNPRGSFLIDSSGRYLIKGEIFDLKNQTNLTEIVYQNHYSIHPKQLPISQAMKEVKGNGKRTLYVFADPDCPACQALQAKLEDVNDITIYTFPFALTHLHPTALTTAKKIWCAKEPLNTWKKYLIEDKKPENQSIACQNPIDKNMELAKKHKIALTPTIFNSQGQRIAGVPELEQLEEFIDSPELQ
ncbi:disulfide bond formation protein DsbC [Acinetobacter sp. ANC 4169]|uniref:DsbC family protein n=1 Tax=Acinetobacter sp. ANC 4169 TaxID=1977879 RepID=UPI000A33EA99|nr:DsbC family protein [Acinetobacter sp. ANC 4169]OTG75136.1 disulfide bond formation protein DsbC [Acinetobacter sp. ANC 4169]